MEGELLRKGRKAMINVICPVRICMLAQHIYAATKLGMWGFNSKWNCAYSTSMYQEELQKLFELSGCVDYLKTQKGGCRRPVLLGDSLGLVWIAEHYFYEANRPGCLIVFGPMFLSHASTRNLEDSLWSSRFPQQTRFQMLRILQSIPVIPFSVVRQYAFMLHHCITEEDYDSFKAYDEEILEYQSDTLKSTIQNGPALPAGTPEDLERTMFVEQIVLKCIREGDKSYAAALNNVVDYDNLLVSYTGKPLRDGKNTVIVFAARCCGAAVEGGVSVQAARQLEAQYISQAEECTSITALLKLGRQIINECISKVRKSKEDAFLSPAVKASCEYIRSNITNDLTVADIAKRVGYTEYYFTRKFSKEMGIRVTDYIKEVKVEYAKILLSTSSKSIQEISDLLKFGNRNYFSKVFQKATGITPVVWRNQAGEDIKNESTT